MPDIHSTPQHTVTVRWDTDQVDMVGRRLDAIVGHLTRSRRVRVVRRLIGLALFAAYVVVIVWGAWYALRSLMDSSRRYYQARPMIMAAQSEDGGAL